MTGNKVTLRQVVHVMVKSLDISMAQAKSDVLDHWALLMAKGQLPQKHDLDPIALKAALPYSFTAKILASGDARITMAGTFLSDLLGFDAHGMVLSCFFDQPSIARLQTAIAQAHQTHTPQIMILRGPSTHHAQHLAADNTRTSGQMILCPMADNTGAGTRLLGLFGLPTNMTFGAHQCSLSAPIAPEMAQRTQDALKQEVAAGFAEPKADFIRPKNSGLRVIAGGREQRSYKRP